jgi:alpha-tubulin suppressor-like RCC1 family protein
MSYFTSSARLQSKNLPKLLGLTTVGASIWFTNREVNFWFFGGDKSKGNAKTGLTKTYLWGNGYIAPRLGMTVTYRNYAPKLIDTFMGEGKINLQKMSFGARFEAGIDTQGCVYLWPKKTLDPIARDGRDYTARKNLNQIDSSGKFVDVSFTKQFLYGLKDDGNVVRWRLNPKAEPAQDSEPKKKSEKKVKVSWVDGKATSVDGIKDIRQISTGVDHIMFLNSTGEVFSMGDDTLGQCGVGPNGRQTGGPWNKSVQEKPVKLSGIFVS